MIAKRRWHGPAKYAIEVNGHLGNQWTDWFDHISIESNSGMTTITIDILDQAALHGLLARIRDLGLPLISVRRISGGSNAVDSFSRHQ